MLFNFIVGFIVPWISGIVLYFKEKKLLLTIAPITSSIAYTINIWSFQKNYCFLYPFDLAGSSIPFNLGFYPIMATILIYLIKKLNINPYALIFLFSILTTLIEGLGVLVNKVAYYNGWTIFHTFLLYLFSYLLVYIYYLKLRKIRLLT